MIDYISLVREEQITAYESESESRYRYINDTRGQHAMIRISGCMFIYNIVTETLYHLYDDSMPLKAYVIRPVHESILVRPSMVPVKLETIKSKILELILTATIEAT
jgi:hypothetical protein